MTDKESKIIKAANIHASKNFSNKSSFEFHSEYSSFLIGAKSKDSKEYWMSEMHSDEEVLKILYDYSEYINRQNSMHGDINIREWFIQNKSKTILA